MSKTRINRLLAVSLAATIVATGCRWPFTAPPQGARMARVAVCMSPSMARTVVPDLASSIASYSLKLASGSISLVGTATRAAPTYTFVDVTSGSWTLTAVALDAAGSTLGSGSVAVSNLSSGESRSVLIPITFSTSGKGNLNLAVAFPSSTGIDYVQGVVSTYASGSASPTLLATLTPTVSTSGTSSTATFLAADLPSGAGLDLVMTFRRGGANGAVAGVYTESVNIYDNLTSDKWIDPTGKLVGQCSFAETDFFDSNDYLASLVLMTDDSSQTLSLPSFMTVFDAGDAPSNLVRFSAVPSLPSQSISYTWNGSSPIALPTSNASPFYALQSGQNMLVITVTAPDRMTQKTYTVAVGTGSATVVGASGMKMALVNGGTFWRDGTYLTDISTVRGFYLGRYEVTQAQWIAVTGQSTYPGTMLRDVNTSVPIPDVPITGITWYDMLGFCNRLSIQDGHDPVYAITGWDNANGIFPVGILPVGVNTGLASPGYRLPTDSEWQWAMMGGTNDSMYTGGGTDLAGYQKSYSGDTGNPANIYSSISTYVVNSWYGGYIALAPVGSLLANELGVYDLSGNAAEWCWDDDSSIYEGNGSLVDYQGGMTGTLRDVRGGSVMSDPSYYGPMRSWNDPSTADPYIGFRLARDNPSSQTAVNAGMVTVRPNPDALLGISGSTNIYSSPYSSFSYIATGDSFDQYTWYLNGSLLTATYSYDSTSGVYLPIPIDPASNSIDLMFANMPNVYLGPNRLTVVAKKGSSYYSEEITLLCTGGC